MGTAAYTQTCPKCNSQVPVYPGYPTWCECGWEKDYLNWKPNETFIGRVWKWLGVRHAEQLNREAIRSAEKLGQKRTRLTLTFCMAFLVAGLVHGMTISLSCVAGWLTYQAIIHWQDDLLVLNFAKLFAAGLVLLFVWKISPSINSEPKNALRRQNAPVLFQAMDRIAGVVGVKPMELVIPSWEFMFGHNRVGWHFRSGLLLGLPALDVIDGPELTAVLAHELAHKANNDVLNSYWIGWAIDTLEKWFEIFRPLGAMIARKEGLPPFTAIVVVPLWLISSVICIFAYLMSFLLGMLLFNHRQWTEYHADAVSARVAGRKAVISSLRKAQLAEVYNRLLNTVANFPETDVWKSWKQLIADIPDRAYLRADRLIAKGEPRFDSSHPIDRHRIAFLECLETDAAMVTIGQDEFMQIKRELSEHEGAADREFRKLLQNRSIAW